MSPEAVPIHPASGVIVSYASIDDAYLYFQDRLYVNSWEDATLEEQQKALAMATRNIDRLAFRGDKADPDQEREWPRGTQTVVPERIKQACCELALALLDINPEEEVDSLRLSSSGFSSSRSSFNETRPEWIVGLIPSATAWSLLLPYLRDRNQIHLSRV